MTTLIRRYAFSAAHKLWKADWTPEENAAHFGACTRLHGHNYRLEIVLRAPINPQWGMIISQPDLDALVQTHILSHVANRYLDEDVPFLSGTLSTVENLARCFYQRLGPALPPSVKLVRVRVHESSEQWVDFTLDDAKALAA